MVRTYSVTRKPIYLSVDRGTDPYIDLQIYKQAATKYIKYKRGNEKIGNLKTIWI